ncbi:hypothetical protein WJX84_010489 [Apatococcus fuscideae]|uniref:DUF218 domain-containing protein n=1 Tax=Apatococcus fuscideae TaxID=2026836 RepID=A0AAW1T607_9CHLO
MERLAQIAMIGIAAVVAQLVLCLQGASSWQHPALSVNRLKSWTTKARPLPAGQVVMAGIVLGYRLQRDGTPSKTLEERVDMGLHLFDQGLSKWLVFSGGLPRGQNVTEAEAMKQYALQATSHRPGVERWKLERRSRSTRENALFSLEIAAGSRVCNKLTLVLSHAQMAVRGCRQRFGYIKRPLGALRIEKLQ